MTTDLKSTVNVELGWAWRDRAGLFQVTDSNRLLWARSLADGTGIEQANAVWHAQDQALAAGQSRTLHLTALVQNLFGDTITIPLSKVKAILIVNKAAGSGALVVGGAGSQEWAAPFGMLGDTLKVMPGSPVVLANLRDGWGVDAASEALKLAASGGDVVYDIAILGLLGSQTSSSSDSSSSSL